ncbi:MAG: hydrogenase nickel incorporation protein HypB [Spirochaetes bacterium]|nr:hydrogenase nickel incorporation protein HypB [Spirochaetota bacterium]
MKVNVMSDILKANDLLAKDIETLLGKKGIVAWNIMGSPGAGKTAVLERSIPMLTETHGVAVIEGDLATANDAERIARTGVQSSQINTNGACHLDAAMVRTAMETIDLDTINLLFIENVGNLVCPAGFLLGEKGRIIVSSITEGDDKPEKYPSMFSTADLVLMNKMDLVSSTDFREEYFRKGVKKLRPEADIIAVSARDGSGLREFVDWITEHSRVSP